MTSQQKNAIKAYQKLQEKNVPSSFYEDWPLTEDGNIDNFVNKVANQYSSFQKEMGAMPGTGNNQNNNSSAGKPSDEQIKQIVDTIL